MEIVKFARFYVPEYYFFMTLFLTDLRSESFYVSKLNYSGHIRFQQIIQFIGVQYTARIQTFVGKSDELLRNSKPKFTLLRTGRLWNVY